MCSVRKHPRQPPISVLRRYLISGRVQGVYFRHSTRLEALRLGLRGYVRNLADGSVEVLAQGSPSSLEELRSWLHLGPALARVEGVREIEPEAAAQAQVPKAFEVL